MIDEAFHLVAAVLEPGPMESMFTCGGHCFSIAIWLEKQAGVPVKKKIKSH